MGRGVYRVGQMVGVDPGYHSGIWLRSEADLSRCVDSVHVSAESRMLILEVSGNSVMVIGEGGVVGWTWMNRLKRLD
jgi:hypothetical protein